MEFSWEEVEAGFLCDPPKALGNLGKRKVNELVRTTISRDYTNRA
jgi:hypothetical protein